MINQWAAYGFFGISAVLVGCSGKTFNDVGEVPSDHGSGAGAPQGSQGGNPDDSSSGGPGSNTDPGGGSPSASGGSSSASAGGPSASAGAPQQSGDLAGTWTGYVENFMFKDGSDAIEFTIANGVLMGTSVVGASGEPPAPATDAEQAYPPGTVLSGLPAAATSAPYPGLVYALQNASRAGSRFQFDLDLGELYQSWCALQASYVNDSSPTGYGCLPNWGATGTGNHCTQQDPATHAAITRSCAQLSLCSFSQICSCTETRCVASPGNSVHFDLVIASGKADGSVGGLRDGSVHNAHLTKSE